MPSSTQRQQISPVVAHLPFADHVHKIDATQNDPAAARPSLSLGGHSKPAKSWALENRPDAPEKPARNKE
jgi:hypothetical protein